MTAIPAPPMNGLPRAGFAADDGRPVEAETSVGSDSTTDWRLRNATWLAARLTLLRVELEERARTLRASGSTSIGWLVAGMEAPVPDASDARLVEARGRLQASADAMSPLSPPALQVLSLLAGLTALEQEVLLLAAAPSLDGGFATAYAELHGDSRLDRATLQLALSLTTDPPERLAAADVLLPRHALRRLRLVDVDLDGAPIALRPIRVDDRVTDYLRGVNRIDERLAGYLRPIEARSRLGHDPLVARVRETFAADADRWLTVNLVGPADAGSADAAVRALSAIGLQPCRLEIDRFAALGPIDQAEILALIALEAMLASVAVIVDAGHLDRHDTTAAALTDVIERLESPLVVLSTERWPATDAAVDVIPVARPTRAEQRVLWRSALAPFRNSVNGELNAIVEQFDFGPQAIAEAVDRAAGRGDATISAGALWDACRDQTPPRFDDLARRIETAWTWDDIVLDADVRSQLHELADQVAHRATVYESWGFGATLGRGRGITALFAGPSGTGKTMAAEIIARHLRLDLYRIDLAGVVNKYVGETEKNLRRVFDAAQAHSGILLFDEADALFGTRTEVRDSHDRYANLEINYLLQAMEDYAGLAILSTNRRAALDGAFLRRLRFILEFPFPDADARRQIWERAFPPAARVDGLDHSFLAGLELSGGSIRSIAINAAFLAAAESIPIAMSHVVRAVAREYGKLGRPIGTAEFGPWLTVARP